MISQTVIPQTCRSVRADGQPCRCFAVRKSIYCRHHQSKVPGMRMPGSRPEASPASPTAERPMTQAEITAGWRFYHREIRSETETEGLDGDVQIILAALANRQISHRSAGRILQTIEDRRSQLLESQLRAQLILQQYIEATQKAQSIKEGTPS